MTFLFDNPAGQSVFAQCADWDRAEEHAEKHGLELVGEFVGWADDDGELEYLN